MPGSSLLSIFHFNLAFNYTYVALKNHRLACSGKRAPAVPWNRALWRHASTAEQTVPGSQRGAGVGRDRRSQRVPPLVSACWGAARF